jgi:hypothetical protein
MVDRSATLHTNARTDHELLAVWLKSHAATLAVDSVLGDAGGSVGPLLVGWVLDPTGGMLQLGWGLSFLSVAMLMGLALITF